MWRKNKKSKDREKRIEELKQKLQQADEEYNRLIIEDKKTSAEQHRLIKQIGIMEHRLSLFFIKNPDCDVTKMFPPQYVEDYSRLKEEVLKNKDEFLRLYKPLPTTKVPKVDWLFSYFSMEAAKKDIDFDLQVNGDIQYMVKNIIDQTKLETMLGDHIQDAIIAVEHGNNASRDISVILGNLLGFYELTVYDSGIEFEIDTLMRLGIERVTTHAHEKGSGIGFMTTFDILNEYNASLIIGEFAPGDSNYTKSVSIRFDNSKKYLIRTYRHELFPAQNEGKFTIMKS